MSVRVKTADEALREHPHTAIGIAAGVGLLIGFLLARRTASHDLRQGRGFKTVN